MSTKDAPIPRPKSKPVIASSNSSIFASSLQSLLSASSITTGPTTAGRPRSSGNKSDIFTSHNRNTKKRAAKDLEDDDNAAPHKKANLEAIDAATLHRS